MHVFYKFRHYINVNYYYQSSWYWNLGFQAQNKWINTKNEESALSRRLASKSTRNNRQKTRGHRVNYSQRLTGSQDPCVRLLGLTPLPAPRPSANLAWQEVRCSWIRNSVALKNSPVPLEISPHLGDFTITNVLLYFRLFSTSTMQIPLGWVFTFHLSFGLLITF